MHIFQSGNNDTHTSTAACQDTLAVSMNPTHTHYILNVYIIYIYIYIYIYIIYINIFNIYLITYEMY